MAEEEVGIRLALKNRREVQHGINEVGDEFDRVGDEAQQAGRKARIGAAGMVAFGKSGRLAGRAVVYGFGAASAAVVGAGIALTKFSKDSIGEAREAQKVGAVTAQIIKSTGGIANISARQVGDLAGAISVKAGIDDEAIQSGSNLLLTFKNVRNETGRGAKIFDRATRSAVDLSAAGFGSIESGSKMLGKALNDPLKGITALSRAGVTFTEGQKKQIERFVEQNDLLSAQKMVLKEVESQVGGVAAEQRTWGEQAAVSWGNIQESLGTALLPMLDRTQRWFVQEGAPALENYVSIFERRGIPKIQEFAGIFERRGVPAIKDFYREAKPLVDDVLPQVAGYLSTTKDTVSILAPKLKTIFDSFNSLPDWAKEAVVIGGAGATIAGRLGVGKLLGSRNLGGTGIIGAVTRAKPLPVIVVNEGFGVPGAPGSKPNAPVPVGSPGTGPGAPKLPGLLTTLALGAGVTYFSKDGVINDLAGKKIDTDGQQLALGTLNKSLSETGKSLALGADNAAEFDQALRNLSYNASPAKAAQHFMDYADRVGMTRDALAKAVPGFAGAMRTWQQESLTAGNRTKWLTTLINGPGGLSPAIAAVERPHVGSLRIDGLDAAIEKTNTVRQNLLNMPALGSYGSGLGVLAPPKKPKARALGGDVRAGDAYVVGERRPELFFPKVDGYIHPRIPEQPRFGEEFWGDARSADGAIHIHNYIDGRQVSETVIDRFTGEEARR
ncbi:hypothetical protein [Nocardioides soli]|uniref:Uncharacterized protein n=1 Tax=Nocardioides soli TaxID=1036020 RepID=A0A7W4Z0Q6_9ACTN|nr:hypothetical protein [Nocardioides soli]MBB3041026.1 hypothetical protein [Nocardioides soli]